MHSVHVDDCADAYLALAEDEKRGEVAGQALNICNVSYDTAQEIADALVKTSGLQAARVEPPEIARTESMHPSVHFLAKFWQWVSSDKIRSRIGWSERKSNVIQVL